MRAITSYLICPEQVEPSSAAENDEKLIWIEHVLLLALSLMHSSTALHALTDNGFISLMISVLREPPMPNGCNTRTYIETLLAQCLDAAISNHSQALLIFKDAYGADVILGRVILELEEFGLKVNGGTEGLSSSSSLSLTEAVNTITAPKKNFVQYLLLLCSTYFHDARQDGPDSRQAQVIFILFPCSRHFSLLSVLSLSLSLSLSSLSSLLFFSMSAVFSFLFLL